MIGLGLFGDARDGTTREFWEDSFNVPTGLYEARQSEHRSGFQPGGRGSEAIVFDEAVVRKVWTVDAEISIDAASDGAFSDGLLQADFRGKLIAEFALGLADFDGGV